MIRNPTTLILGAGASSELGFPLGAALKDKIKLLCERRNNPKVEFEQLTTYLENSLDRARLNLPQGIDQETFHAAQLALSDNIQSVDSIDHFLGLNAHSSPTALAGKVAIARAISMAEIESYLAIEHSTHRSAPGFKKAERAEQSYLHRLWVLLSADINRANVGALFTNLTIVNFNYDRSVEWFFFVRLQQALDISAAEAAEIVASLKIVRPYGSIGTWGHQRSGDHVPFAYDLQGDALLAAAGTVRTLSDDDLRRIVPSQIVQVRQALHQSLDVIVLGSAFHKPNINVLDLSDLTPSRYDDIRRVWCTGFGLGNIAVNAIRSELSLALRTQLDLVSFQPHTARQLMDELTYLLRA